MGWLSALFKGLSKSAVKSTVRKAAPKIAKTVAKNALAGATQYGTNHLMSSILGGSGRRRRRRNRRRRGRIHGRGIFRTMGSVLSLFGKTAANKLSHTVIGMHGRGRRITRLNGRGWASDLLNKKLF